MAWVAAALCVVVCLAVGSHRPANPASLSAREAHLTSIVRCPVCSGLSVAESNAPVSLAVRADIHARLVAGQSDEQILSYVESRYGPSILLLPPRTGISALVWAAPLVVVGAGAVGLGVLLWRRRATAAAFVPVISDEQRAAVEREVARLRDR